MPVMTAPKRPSAELVKALLLQAIEHHKAGRGEMTEKLCLQVLALDVRHPYALFLLALSGRQRGLHEMSVKMMRRAVKLNDRDPLFLANLGLALQETDELEEAEANFRRALELNPDQPEALFGLGNLYWKRKDGEQAQHWLRRTVAVQPDYSDAWNNLGVVLKHAGKLAESLECYENAVAHAPNNSVFLTNLGDTLHTSGRYQEAVVALKRALQSEPKNLQAHQKLAYACFDNGDLTESLQYCRSALELDPKHGPTLLNVCMLKLLQGDYASGWPEYEMRWQVYTPRVFPQPLWKGEPLAGKRILLHAEQGLGDSLQFLRFVALVQTTGAEIVLEVPDRLMRLAAQIPGIATLVKANDPLPEFDYQIPLLSLPARFATTVETIPAQVPYLRPPDDALARAASLNWPTTGLRVGLAWGGSPTRQNDMLRSFQLSRLAPLFDLPGVHFFSLQMGPPLAQLEPYREKIADLAPVTADMADTAAQIMNLDLVISVDTSIAHLTGALGKPLWVMLSVLPDWRWLLERTDSPWYPTARLFRQPRWGDWDAVVEALRTALIERAAHSSK